MAAISVEFHDIPEASAFLTQVAKKSGSDSVVFDTLVCRCFNIELRRLPSEPCQFCYNLRVGLRANNSVDIRANLSSHVKFQIFCLKRMPYVRDSGKCSFGDFREMRTLLQEVVRYAALIPVAIW